MPLQEQSEQLGHGYRETHFHIQVRYDLSYSNGSG